MRALGRRPSFAVPNPALRPVALGRPTLLRRKGKITGLNSRDYRARAKQSGRKRRSQPARPAWGYAKMANHKNHPAEARFGPKDADQGAARLPRARPLRRRIAALGRVCCVFFSLRRKRSAAPGALFAWSAFDAPKLASFAPVRRKPDARGCFSSTRFAGKRPSDKGRKMMTH